MIEAMVQQNIPCFFGSSDLVVYQLSWYISVSFPSLEGEPWSNETPADSL